ncbi:DUF4380 domain-containing protein [Xanthomonas sp. XNM01]|uniref:DUF4380 domain-containing protein n=1 Tax=Xanthomonas sp. XNM01 TaxID=2769289 RepID=UPI00177E75B9|nr:DUF4380 domain-containing protein [Xanthomonas sp. XNM01]MBD9368730.1 DUF4380 domain-containing protein [Xanthomonas sp. XNM01]
MRLTALIAPAILAAGLATSAAAQAPVDERRLVLESPQLRLEVLPTLGGRVLHFGARGAPNLLAVGEDALRDQPHPRVHADAGNIGYLGHEIWAGPQRDWWRDQTVNPARRAAAADWPPDPWLAYAEARVLVNEPQRLVVEGAASPVSGVQLTQSFTLAPQRPDAVELTVEMRNTRAEPVARDIWFNTRVHPETRVYVPLAADGSGLRVRSDMDDTYDGLVSTTADGLFSLELLPPAEGRQGRRGKVFIQPRAGWIAGFAAGQAFLIHFEHQPRARIHPEQGQVELYLDWKPGQVPTGLLELEVHGPYETLQPGESISAHEWWVVRRYDGPDRRDAQIAFLRRMLREAGVE